mgnify:CR=1 FL=1|jgi:predicted  nucleic acid-binding Zn-ribbon protein
MYTNFESAFRNAVEAIQRLSTNAFITWIVIVSVIFALVREINKNNREATTQLAKQKESINAINRQLTAMRKELEAMEKEKEKTESNK